MPLSWNEIKSRALGFSREWHEASVKLAQETSWLSQAQMILLFDRGQSVIPHHIRNLFTKVELPEEGTMQKMRSAKAGL